MRIDPGGSSVATAGGPAPADVMLPGATARLRAVQGVLGPADVPVWMTQGGASARAAAAAMAADSAVVRRVGDTMRAVLLDASTALGWQGSAAQAAQVRAQSLYSQLAAVASQLDAAHDALAGFGAALDSQQPALGSPAASWARSAAEPDRQLTLLRQWQPAAQALDAVDARTARTLREVASALARVHTTVDAGSGGQTAAPTTDPSDDGVLSTITRSVGTFCAGTVNALASFANAMGQHPADTAQLAAGYLLTMLGAGGEALGVTLDLTGIGALVGVPTNVLSAGVIAAGLGVTGSAVAQLGQQAAGDDHVTLMEAGGATPKSGSAGGGAGAAGDASRPAPRIDIQGANYAQKTASRTFSKNGRFAGKTIDEVASRLRAHELTPDDVPIDIMRRDGKTLILNTRSSRALEEAGIPRSRWRVVDRTGQAGYERRLSNQLRNNGLDSNGTDTVEVLG